MAWRPDDQRSERGQSSYTDEGFLQPSKRAYRDRHGCFTIWLILMMIASGGSALYWLIESFRLVRVFSAAQVWAVIIVLAIETIFLFGIYRWQRWAVYGFIVTLIISGSLRYIIGAVRETSLFSIGFAFFMLFIFVRPNWHHYANRKLIGFEE